ncbi:hypothetical protein GW17_00005921 [Ensete ventricosum]|nr:hypothetical protein GW17_00005921 [Ensete ventricosum]
MQAVGSISRNIVSTVNLDCKLDLKAIALQARNAEYNPKRFAAVIMRIREPKTTALIFASGKMVSPSASLDLQAMRFKEVPSGRFGRASGLNQGGEMNHTFSLVCTGAKSEQQSKLAARKYEPELFPGLIYRMKQPKIVLLIFVSGKIVLTGAKVKLSLL